MRVPKDRKRKGNTPQKSGRINENHEKHLKLYNMLKNNPIRPWGDMYNSDKYSRLRVHRAVVMAYSLYEGHNPHVLDVGCYTMEVRNHLPNYCSYTGIDMLEKHEDIIRIDLNQFPNYKLEFLDKKYDLIFALEIVEHILYPTAIMKAFQLSLAKDGVICFSLPNENTLYHRIVMAIGIGCDAQAFKDYKHVHFPTIRQQRRFISEYFKIVEEGSYISTDMHKSRGEWIGKIAKKIPDTFWRFIADKFPALFARGRIYVCRLKQK